MNLEIDSTIGLVVRVPEAVISDVDEVGKRDELLALLFREIQFANDEQMMGGPSVNRVFPLEGLGNFRLFYDELGWCLKRCK